MFLAAHTVNEPCHTESYRFIENQLSQQILFERKHNPSEQLCTNLAKFQKNLLNFEQKSLKNNPTQCEILLLTILILK